LLFAHIKQQKNKHFVPGYGTAIRLSLCHSLVRLDALFSFTEADVTGNNTRNGKTMDKIG